MSSNIGVVTRHMTLNFSSQTNTNKYNNNNKCPTACVCVLLSHLFSTSGLSTVPLQLYDVCVCVCVGIPFILDVRFVDVPAGVTLLEEGHTGFLHLPSAVLAFILNFSREKDSAVPLPRRP